MRLYKFHVDYVTRSGNKKSTDVETYAPSQTAAKRKIVKLWEADKRRNVYAITKWTPTGGSTDVVVNVTANTLDPETVRRIGRSMVEPAAPVPFPVGSVVHIKQGLTTKDLGVYKVRASFVDNAGNSARTLEREGCPRPQGSRRYLTTAIENLPAMQQPRETVEYKVLYPDDRVFTQTQPNTFSSYGLDQLVQIKLTKVNGKIIRKEIV